MRIRGWIVDIEDSLEESSMLENTVLLIEHTQHSARSGKALLMLTEAPTLMDFQ